MAPSSPTPAPQPVRVSPRGPGDPAPDLLHLRIAHRMVRRDLERLTALAQEVAAGSQHLDRRRATALARYVDKAMTSIHHHHSAEDEVLWPVVVASCHGAVDLDELSDDHAALDPHLRLVRAAVAAVAADPASADAARALATALADLTDLLVEHIDDEERALFPVMTVHVSVRDWKHVAEQVGRRDSDLPFVLPRAADAATPEELAVLLREAGPVFRVLLALLRPRHRRFEALVFGPAIVTRAP